MGDAGDAREGREVTISRFRRYKKWEITLR
jgi:hypothetical protein